MCMTRTIHIIETVAEFANLEKTWGEFLSSSPSDNYFLTWEWLWNWWNVYAQPGDRLAIALITRGDETVGIAPLYVRNKLLGGLYPVRRMMFLGTQEEGSGDVCSDYMDVICREGEEGPVLELLFKTIDERDMCDEICLHRIDTSAKTFPFFQRAARKLKFLAIAADEYTSPYIKLPGSWDDYLSGLTPLMRKRIRSGRRKLLQDSAVTVKKAGNDADLTEFFERLVELHHKRWDSKGMEGAFSHRQFDRFHRTVMPAMMRNGHLDLVLLSKNDEAKAVLYNIVYKNKIYFYQSGIDTTDKKASFGTLSLGYCIEEAIKKGMEEYDFLPKGGTDGYKDRFSNAWRTVADIYMARDRMVKYLVKARETARWLYHRIKPCLKGAD
jgi:CelD/BcsL family acetyltransferase involved in cellulose biosynthesis